MTLSSISIIIPTYNVAPYIHKCLESVAAQTYTGTIECLIVDDCGQDNSIQIAEEFINEYKGPIDFRIIHREKNGGLSAARNTGIRKAIGEYLYFLDSDDWIIPECIEQMVECLKKYPESEVVIAGVIPTSEKGYGWADITKKHLPEYSEDKLWIKHNFLQKKVFAVTAWNKLIQKKFLLSNNLYFKEGIIHEDEHWNYYLAKHVSRLAICSVNTYIYNIRPGSIVTSQKSKDFESYKIIYADFITNIDEECHKEQLFLIYDYLRDVIVHKSQGQDRKDFSNILKKAIFKFSGKRKIMAIYYSYFYPYLCF